MLGHSRSVFNEIEPWADSSRPEERRSNVKLPLIHQEAGVREPRYDSQHPAETPRFELVPLE